MSDAVFIKECSDCPERFALVFSTVVRSEHLEGGGGLVLD